jgi:hypothetical protein
MFLQTREKVGPKHLNDAEFGQRKIKADHTYVTRQRILIPRHTIPERIWILQTIN